MVQEITGGLACMYLGLRHSTENTQKTHNPGLGLDSSVLDAAECGVTRPCTHHIEERRNKLKFEHTVVNNILY